MLFQVFLIYIISNFFLFKYSENILDVHLKYYNFSAIIWLSFFDLPNCKSRNIFWYYNIEKNYTYRRVI